MKVQVSCSGCGKTANVRETHLGCTVRCTGCEKTFIAEATQDDSPPPVQATSANKETHEPNERNSPPTMVPPTKETAGPSPDKVGRTTAKLPAASRPDFIGRFEVRSRLGAGAFGTVYRAYDPQLDREVALKVPQGGAMETPKQVERFLREAKAAAQLCHPHIVPIYDAGRDGSHYYIASAFVKGRTLSRAADDGKLPFQQGTQIVRELAEALAYAHDLGIVHRDVKSSNVMLDEQGKAHLMDFGLAYRQDLTEKLTHDGAVLGTPAYMAPEQAKGKSGKALPASDQYSLGVILYELLCGELPFSGPVDVVLFNAIHQEPPAPRTHRKDVPVDLETICLKAMNKSPEGRYANCRELADDLRRWQEGEPIKARRMGPVERVTRWCQREPKLAVVAAVAVCSLGAVALLTLASAVLLYAKYRSESEANQRLSEESVKTREAKEQAEQDLHKRIQAEEERKAALQSAEIAAANLKAEGDQKLKLAEEKEVAVQEVHNREYDANMKLIAREWDNAYLLQARDMLNRQEEKLRSWEWHYLNSLVTRPSLRELKYKNPVNAVSFSSDGQFLATAGDDCTVRVTNANTKEEVLNFAAKVPAKVVAFSKTGLLACGWADGMVRVFDPRKQGTPLLEFAAHTQAVTCLTFRPDPKLECLVTGSTDKTVKRWDVSGPTVKGLDLPKGSHATAVASVVFSPDGRILVSAAQGGAEDVKAWDFVLWEKSKQFPQLLTQKLGPQLGPLTAQEALKKIWPSGAYEPYSASSGHHGGVSSLAFHYDSREIALGSPDNTVSILRFKLQLTKTGFPAPLDQVEMPDKPEVYFLGGGHSAPVNGVVYCPKTQDHEDRFASVSDDLTVKVWDRKTCVPLFSFKGHLGAVTGVAISPDGKRLASSSRDCTVKVWDLTSNQEVLQLRVADKVPVLTTAFSPDSKFLAFGGGWPNRFGNTVLEGPDRVPTTPQDKAELRVWNTRSGEPFSLRDNGHTKGVTCVAFGQDGQQVRLASGSLDQTVKVWDVANKSYLFTLPHNAAVHAVAFSPDGKRLATAGADSIVRLWDAANGSKLLKPLTGHTGAVYALAFSQDGKLLASAGADEKVYLWDADTGNLKDALSIPGGHIGEIYAVAFSPDHKRVAWAGADGVVRFWNRETRKGENILKGHAAAITGIAFSRDSKRVASASVDRTVKVWDVDTSQEVLNLTAFASNAMSVSFSPDGLRLAAADYAGAANVYDTTPHDPSPAVPPRKP